jgi:Heavy metal binding domain
MRGYIMLVLVPVVFLGFMAAIAAAPEEDACDMKTVVKGFYCEACEEVMMTADLVSDVTYYACPDCDETSDEAGDCELCEVALVKKVSGKGVCKHCLKKPSAAEVCEKIYYSCPDCDAVSRKPGNCADCEVALEKQVDRAVIFYVCAECGQQSLKAGKCTDAECEGHGKPLVKECSSSGEFPHGGEE